MYRQCTTEKTSLQQKQFETTLLAMMQEQDYNEIRITDLCKRAELTRNIFYRLFDSKEDVLFFMIDNCFLKCSNSTKDISTKEKLVHFFEFWKSKRLILEVLNKNRLGVYLVTRGIPCCFLSDLGLQQMVDAEWKDYDKEILSFYLSGFIGLLFYWCNNNFHLSSEEMAEIAYQISTNPPLIPLE